jgi:hypothetical protein
MSTLNFEEFKQKFGTNTTGKNMTPVKQNNEKSALNFNEFKQKFSSSSTTQPLPETASYSTNGKFNPLALTQDVHNIAQTARQEQQQSKINEITGGQPTAFMPMKLNVDEIEEAEKVAKKNIEKSNKLNSIVKTPEIMKDNLRRFEDGYNFGDVTKTGLETVGDTVLTVGGTAGDIVLNAAKGVLSVPENMAKAGASAVAGVADLAGADDWANNIRRNVAYKNIYTDPTQKAIDFVDKASIAGTPIDNIASGIGQVGGTVATTYALGKAGLDHVGFMPTTAILQGAGAGATEAYQRADASVGLENMTWKEKLQNALKIGGSAALAGTAEGIFGLFGVGGTPFTTKIGNALINKASTPMLKVLTKMGYSGLGEAGEEFLEYIGNVGLNNLINKFGATDYSTEFDGKEIAKEALTSFIVSAITQGGSSSIQMRNIANQQISQIEKELGRKLTPNEIKKVANNIADQLLIEAEETDVSESSQIEQTQPTNEVIPPTAQNQNTANVVQNNANMQNNVQNQSNIEQISQNNVENAQNKNYVNNQQENIALPTAEQLNQPSQEMIEAAQALTLEEPQNITEKSQQLFDELFANDNLPQTYKFEMGERIERATTLNELEKIRNEIQNYKSDLSKETIDERVVRVNEFIEAQKTKGQQTTKKEIRNKITDLLEIPNKGANVKALSQIAGEINQLLSEGKLTDTRINEIVNALPERVRSINEDFLNEYKELKTELKNRPIYVSENVRKGFPSWSDFKKNNLNKLKLTADNKNITVEQLYQELSGQYEDLFPNDISNPADQLEQISNVVSSIKRDVEDIDTVLISKYGQEGWNEIQDMLKDELKTIRDNLARTDELVEYYEGGIKNRSWTKTSNKNELVNEFLDVKDIQYRVQSNPSTVRMANETLNNLGYEESYNLIKNTIASGRRVKAEDIALGERLIQESIKKGDFERATELISDVTIIGTELGQAVQAMRLINKLSPQGQLMYLQKVVNRMNAQNDQKNAKRDNKKLNELETKVEKGEQIKIGDNEIKIPEESQQELLKAQTQEEIDLAIEKIKEQLAAQLPVETFEKLDEWRYLSMLGRPKSHLRNVLSNIAMRGTYELKNEIQRGVEALAKNSLDERTRTFKKSTKTVKNFAKQSAEDNLNAIKGNGKLTVDKDIKSRRKIFNSELLERARKFNSNALDMEDTVFSKSAYVSNLAEYLTANGIKTQQDIDLNPDIVEKGIQFAIKESQKTTFRQYSALANAMNQVENINGISKVVIGGTLPFKKTPINIAKTGASYSPAGLIETLTLETKKLRDGKITGNEYIDRLSQGLTGTLITGLGYLLADIGVLSGAGEEDDEYAEAIGERAPYSINIGNGHYNLSWLSPTAMPMFIGAEIQKAVQNEEDVDLNNIIDFLATTLDPLSEMSMVSSINDAIKNYGNSETSTGAISSVAGNAIGSYAGQYLPSIFSDINKIIDPTVRSTQASKNSKFKSGERLLRQSLNKLPGGSYLLEPATDIWGNEKKRSDSIFARAADALISPGTYTQKKTTDVDRELMKQYDENSNKDILPKVPKNYFSSNGYKYEMSAKEYTNYKKEYGQTAYKELKKLFSSKEYKEMDSEDKQKAIKDVYEQAQEKARFEYGLNPASLLAKYNEEEASKRLLGAKRSEKQQDSGIALIDFYEAWQAQKDVEGQKNFKGETISGTTKTNKIKAMKEAVPDLSMWELNKLYDVLN